MRRRCYLKGLRPGGCGRRDGTGPLPPAARVPRIALRAALAPGAPGGPRGSRAGGPEGLPRARSRRPPVSCRRASGSLVCTAAAGRYRQQEAMRVPQRALARLCGQAEERQG